MTGENARLLRSWTSREHGDLRGLDVTRTHVVYWNNTRANETQRIMLQDWLAGTWPSMVFFWIGREQAGEVKTCVENLVALADREWDYTDECA